MTLSELKRRKFRHYFDLLDRNKDGLLERDDFQAVVKTAAALRGFVAGSPPYEALETMVMLTWAHTQEFTDSNRSGAVAPDEWYQTLEATIASEEQYAIYVTPFAVGLFDLLDGDADGFIGPEEYRHFLVCFGSDASATEDIFAAFDADGDGRLSKDEALELVRDFHMSDDLSSPGNLLFGRF